MLPCQHCVVTLGICLVISLLRPNNASVHLPFTCPSASPPEALSLLHVIPLLHGRFAVASTGATNHMVPNKSCFISYKSIFGLSVQMGNKSYILVLG
jgi:hypothetical protein